MGIAVRRAALAAAFAALLAACSRDVAAPTALAIAAVATPSAGLAVAIEAAPVAQTRDRLQPFQAAWRVVIQETGGVGGRLLWVNATVRDAASGARAWPAASVYLGTDQLVPLLGSDRMPAHGTVTVPGQLKYALPSGGRIATVDVAVQLVDDNGHRVSVLTQAELR